MLLILDNANRHIYNQMAFIQIKNEWKTWISQLGEKSQQFKITDHKYNHPNGYQDIKVNYSRISMIK